MAAASTKQARTPAVKAAAKADKTVNFTFGDPEAVLDRRELFDLFETVHNGRWGLAE